MQLHITHASRNLVFKTYNVTSIVRIAGKCTLHILKVHPLYYGAFSSHGPCYDSTFANLTKEETDLVASTYGDDVGVQYAESILNFSR